MQNMNEAEIERLEKKAMKMPSWNDFVVDAYRKNPELAKLRVGNELEEYAQTGEIKYLLATLKDVASAKGWTELAKETGLSRQTLYKTLNGQRFPRVDTLAKILHALDFRMSFIAVEKSKGVTKSSQKRAATGKPRKPAKRLQHA